VISLEEAQALIEEAKPENMVECHQVAKSLGMRLAEPVAAPFDSPAFDNSAMDGFAVGSSGAGPWQILGEAAAGSRWDSPLGPTEAIRIFTGAPMPARGVAVLPIEDAQVKGNHLVATCQVSDSAHIRRQGEEFRAGSIVLGKGTRITPAVAGALASLGIERWRVYCRLRVAILATGSELLPATEPRSGAMIFDSNSVGLSLALSSLGFQVDSDRSIDDPEDVANAAARLLSQSDFLVTTGGVSVGDHDYVPDALASLGFETVFHGVSMKPGKPILFARRQDGKAWLGLPGNPQSAWTGMCVFGLPYLGEPLPMTQRRLAEDLTRKSGRTEFYPGRFVEDGLVSVRPTVGSHATFGLVGADALALVPGDVAQLTAGDSVQVLELPWRSY